MAFNDSKLSVFLLDDTAAAQKDLSAFITDIDGLPGPRNLNEVTALGDSGSKWIPGLENVTITISGIYDDTAVSGPDAVLGPLRTHTAAVDFEYGPEGNVSGDTKYSGTCWVTDFTIRSSVGNRVEFSATLQVEGVTARGTFA